MSRPNATRTWLRRNLFRTPLDTVLTIVFGALAIWLLNPLLVAAEITLLPRVAYGLAFFVGAFIWAVVVFRTIED